jgi:hypothetical protein
VLRVPAWPVSGERPERPLHRRKENEMRFAKILANDPNLTRDDLADFASFMDPEQAKDFMAETDEIRNASK